MRAHAVARLQERYGVDRDDASGIVAKIKARILMGEAHFRRAFPHGASEWEVYIDGRRVRVIWREAEEYVVTVLPERPRRRLHRVEG